MPENGNRRSVPVCVIVPAWNAAGSIARTLESIASQTVAPRETIVIDDGSTDGTQTLVREFIATHPGFDIRLVEQANAGAAAARNAGIRATTAEYVAFLDADDCWLPQKLAHTLPLLRDPTVQIAATDMLVDDGSGELTVMECAKRFAGPQDAFTTQFLKGSIATSTVIARRAAVLAADGFDESLGAAHDYDLWVTILDRHRDGLAMLDEPLTIYDGRLQGITGNAERRRRCSLEVVYRFGGRFGLRSAFISLLRVALVQRQAFQTHRAKGSRKGMALAVLTALPAGVFALLALAFPAVRKPGPDEPGIRVSRAATLGAGLIAIAVIGGWLAQFGGIAGAVLRVLGLG
ncbi:MAG: glycosyltransferase [Rhodospirillales bacterium]